MAGDLKTPLPRLRDDIALARQSALGGGEPGWRIRDPLQHRFFSVSDDTGALLSLWNEASDFEELAAAARRKYNMDVAADSFSELLRFLDESNLLVRGQDAVSGLLDKGAAAKARERRALLTAFLSFRIPLFAPEPLLRVLKPAADAVHTRTFAAIAAVGAAFGLYASFFDLVDAAVAELAQLSLQGVVQIVVALAILKSFHELGHAVAAHRQGCRVPVMGVAFMAFMPMLYTDVTDA